MAENTEVLRDIMEYDEAHYFGINAEIVLGGVITELTESSNPTESEKQYIHQKSKVVKTTGFSNEFPITMDMVKGDKVFDIVNLWEPVAEQENTYKARKITQTCSITECNGAAGEQKQITGSLKGGDFVYGTFNTKTKEFTENV